MESLQLLEKIRTRSGSAQTTGLEDHDIESFVKDDPSLAAAIRLAVGEYEELWKDFDWLLKRNEDEQVATVQENFVNFYSQDALNPYLALAAQGPWIVTSCGAVIHDSGGYGMLGFGHNPQEIMAAITKPQVMANIMTPNTTQLRFTEAMASEAGHTRKDGQSFAKFLCVNSGSEAVSVALRITDAYAHMTLEEGEHQGEQIRFLGLSKGFHGRTDRPAQLSDSNLSLYQKYLASFAERKNLVTVEPNNIAELEAVFQWADDEDVFFEAFFLEPVQGEGSPGRAITPEFYARARQLTAERDSMLVVDSIQAGLRAHGVLSIIDYPGFQDLDLPDMETYSKALNGGQYPFSALALSSRACAAYKHGTYGNTMTANPRGLEVACSILAHMTPVLRSNIVRQGERFLVELQRFRDKYPEMVTSVDGTGLLFSIAIDASKAKVLAPEGIEKWLRIRGIGVIHGGQNAIRFTPHFRISDREVDLVIAKLDQAFQYFSS